MQKWIKTLTKKIVGYKGTDVTYHLCAGEADWDNKVELTELVKYPREVAFWRKHGNTKKLCVV